MFDEYSLLDKLKFEFRKDESNINQIVYLLSDFVGRYELHKATLLNLHFIQNNINEISKIVNLYEKNEINELLKDPLFTTNKELQLQLNQKSHGIKKSTELSVFHRNKKSLATQNSQLIKFLIAKIIYDTLQLLFKQCTTNYLAKKDVAQLLKSPSRLTTFITYLKQNMLTPQFLLMLGLFLFTACYVSIILELRKYNIGWAANYIDLGFLALKYKLITVAIFISIIITKLTISSQINQILFAEKLKKSHTTLFYSTLIKANIIILLPVVIDYMLTGWPNWIISLICIVIVLIPDVLIMKLWRKKMLKLYLGVISDQFVIYVYTLVLFGFISYVVSGYYLPNVSHAVEYILCALFSFYFIFQFLEIDNDASSTRKFIQQQYNLLMFIVFGIFIIFDNSSILSRLDAGMPSNTLSIVNIQMKNNNLEQNLLNTGFNKINVVTNESSIYGALLIESILQPNHDIWLRKLFIVKTESGNIFNYWIYGVNVPFYLKNKIIVLNRIIGKDKFQISLETEKGLNYFDIIYSYPIDHVESSNFITSLKSTQYYRYFKH